MADVPTRFQRCSYDSSFQVIKSHFISKGREGHTDTGRWWCYSCKSFIDLSMRTEFTPRICLYSYNKRKYSWNSPRHRYTGLSSWIKQKQSAHKGEENNTLCKVRKGTGSLHFIEYDDTHLSAGTGCTRIHTITFTLLLKPIYGVLNSPSVVHFIHKTLYTSCKQTSYLLHLKRTKQNTINTKPKQKQHINVWVVTEIMIHNAASSLVPFIGISFYIHSSSVSFFFFFDVQTVVDRQFFMSLRWDFFITISAPPILLWAT